MSDVMKSIRHRPLEGCTSIFQAKREFLICKSAPWADKCSFVLVSWEYIDLIISREAVHKREDFTASTIINDLVDEWCGIVVLGTSAIDIPIINAYSDSALFFSHGDNIRDPINERDRVNKPSFKKFFNFFVNGCSPSRVHGV